MKGEKVQAHVADTAAQLGGQGWNGSPTYIFYVRITI